MLLYFQKIYMKINEIHLNIIANVSQCVFFVNAYRYDIVTEYRHSTNPMERQNAEVKTIKFTKRRRKATRLCFIQFYSSFFATLILINILLLHKRDPAYK